MRKSNIVFGGMLHPDPGCLVGFEVDAERIDSLRLCGQFEIFEGTRLELRKRGEEMVGHWESLSVYQKKMGKVLSMVRGGRGKKVKVPETGDLFEMDMRFVRKELNTHYRNSKGGKLRAKERGDKLVVKKSMSEEHAGKKGRVK